MRKCIAASIFFCFVGKLAFFVLEQFLAGRRGDDRVFQFTHDLDSIVAKCGQHEQINRSHMLRKRQIKKATQNILYRLETDTSELLFDKLRALEREKQSVDRQLAAAQMEIASLDKINIRPICNELGRMLKTSDAPEVKAYLAHAIKEVLISNEEVKITLNIA